MKSLTQAINAGLDECRGRGIVYPDAEPIERMVSVYIGRVLNSFLTKATPQEAELIFRINVALKKKEGSTDE